MTDFQAASSWQLWVDGTALPNPGRIGIGALLTGPQGQREEISTALGQHGCNNEAEMQALIAGLRLAGVHGVQHVQVLSDSDFVVRHVLGSATTAVARLLPLIDLAQGLLAGFDRCELTWLPRHRNGAADALARAALGLSVVAAAPHVHRRNAKRR